MLFGIIGRTGPEIRQVVGFGDRSTGRGTFGSEFRVMGTLRRTCATVPRRGPLPKLLWLDLLLLLPDAWTSDEPTKCGVVCCRRLGDNHLDVNWQDPVVTQTPLPWRVIVQLANIKLIFVVGVRVGHRPDAEAPQAEPMSVAALDAFVHRLTAENHRLRIRISRMLKILEIREV